MRKTQERPGLQFYIGDRDNDWDTASHDDDIDDAGNYPEYDFDNPTFQNSETESTLCKICKTGKQVSFSEPVSMVRYTAMRTHDPEPANQECRLTNRLWLSKSLLSVRNSSKSQPLASKDVGQEGRDHCTAQRTWSDRLRRATARGTFGDRTEGVVVSGDQPRQGCGRENSKESHGRNGEAEESTTRSDHGEFDASTGKEFEKQGSRVDDHQEDPCRAPGQASRDRQEQRNTIQRSVGESRIHRLDEGRGRRKVRSPPPTDVPVLPPDAGRGQARGQGEGRDGGQRLGESSQGNAADSGLRASDVEQASPAQSRVKDRVEERVEDRGEARAQSDSGHFISDTSCHASETGVDRKCGGLGELCLSLPAVGDPHAGAGLQRDDVEFRKEEEVSAQQNAEEKTEETSQGANISIPSSTQPIAGECERSDQRGRMHETLVSESLQHAGDSSKFCLEEWDNMFLGDEYRDTLGLAAEIGKLLSELRENMTAQQKTEKQLENALFIEFCCDPDSELGNEGHRHSFNVLRCTLKDGDLLQPNGRGMRRILQTIAEHHGPMCLHGSLPCTPWSQIQALNEHMHGPLYTEKLKRDRKKSLRMVRNFLVIAKLVLARNGFVSFEWPTTALGWKEDELVKMCEFFGLVVDFHGCALGVKARNGEPMLKPFTITTNNPDLVAELQTKQCKCTRKHVPCEGAETTRSGHYTKQMANAILRGHRKALVRQKVNDSIERHQLLLASAANAATKEEMDEFGKLSKKEQDKLVEAARKIHTNTGHRPPEALARLLRQRGAPLASRAAMEQLRCSTCAENGRPNTAPAVSLDVSGKPFQTLGIDLKEALYKGKKYKYLVLVDESSRLTRCLLLFEIAEKAHRNATTEEVVRAYETGWEELFGNPQTLRHDPEGSLVSQQMLDKFAEKGVHLAATAGEAHWQLGITERMIGTIFNTAEKIAKENDLDFPSAVTLAVKSQNTVDRVRGYSPSQWAFGRQPSWTGDLHDDAEEVNLSRDTSEAFQRKLQLQISARSIFEKEQLNQKLLRAARVQHRKENIFTPGEICFVWRLGGKLAGTKKTGLHRGAWYGPGTILGTESKISEEGTVEPGAIVWVIMNDRLWRCAASQIRRGSEREVAEHTLLQKKPWTFENITSNIQLGTFKDIMREPEPPATADMEVDTVPLTENDEPEPSSSSRKSAKRTLGNGHRYPSKMPRNANLPQAADWAAAGAYANAAMHICEEAFFSLEQTPDKVIEIAFPAFECERTIRKYLRNPEAFVATALRKRKVEVNEKRLTPEEKEMIRTAKGKEIREFIKEKVVTRLLAGEHVDPADIMRMRWVLTWKTDPDEPGGKRGKARLVVLGFQDPWLGREKTSAPTLTKRGKQLLLQLIVQKEWTLFKGDVTAAFLQGRPLTKSKYCLAPPELAQALGLPEGERVVRLLKSVYGLTAAPLEWYEQVNKVLTELGFHRCHTDPTVWILLEPQTEEVCGIVGAHVDDFLMAGQGDHWQKCLDTLMAAFRWTPLETKRFKQCGVDIEQLQNGEIVQSQDGYLSSLGEIDIKPERAKEAHSPVTETERTELRALLGGLQWLVGQTQLHGAVDVNLLQSDVTTATVETLLTANKILRKIRQEPSKLFTRKIEGEIHVVGWSDASWANRKSGSSTGGYVIGLCGRQVLEGKRDHVTIVSWSTNKLKRVARSSLAAEVQALANTEDELHLTRLTWAEFNGARIDLNHVDEIISSIPGTAVIDAKSIYDTLTSMNQPLQLQEKRTALEILAYLQNTEANNTETRWVHGGANLADGLTKVAQHPMLKEFLSSSTWALVQDPKGLSAKRRQTLGIDKLDNKTAGTLLTAERENFSQMAWAKLREVWPSFGQDSESEEE